MPTKKNEVSSVDSVVKALEANPALLSAAIAKLQAAQTGKPAYTILSVEDKEIPICHMEDTRIVRDKKVVKHYLIRLMNGSTLSLPEHSLKDYGINPSNIPMVDEDGLTQEDKNFALTNGAF